MRTRSFAVLLVVLVAVGSIQGSIFDVFCSETGDRGLGLDLVTACVEADCHDAVPAEATCADEDCCIVEELPARPIASNAGGPSFGEDTTIVVGSLAAWLGLRDNDDPMGRQPHQRNRPGPDTGAFAGYRLPLLS